MAPPPQVGEAELQDWEEGTPPPRSPPSPYPDFHEVQRRIYVWLRRTGRHDQALATPSFHDRLVRHLRRLPPRYLINHLHKGEDVLLHWMILDECADPGKRPVFYARLLKMSAIRFQICWEHQIVQVGRWGHPSCTIRAS
uniref:Uncharacterized protein n=1 Tax=Arundo donax TaxID=35708 RepID=A0A0A9D3X2_ARUDO